MKKALLILIASFFFSITLFGQGKILNLGVDLGPSATFLWGNNLLDPSNQVALNFSGAVCFQYNLNNVFSLRTNLASERKGSLVTVDARDERGYKVGKLTIHNNFDYLTLPLLARVSFGNQIKFFINGGPFIGFLLKQTTVQEAFSSIPETKSDNTDSYKATDFGVSFGLGLTIPVAKVFLISLEARNNTGLSNISAVPVYLDGSIKTNSTNLLLGFAYQFGKTLN